MKSRTSFSKLTPFKKDLVRFAPVWILYLVGMLLVLLGSGSYEEYDRYARNFAANLTETFAIINMIYAGVCAVMLYGDLYNTRMCYSLHAMPQRRRSWLLSHLTSGFLFSLVPNLLAAAYMASQLQEYWFLALYWLLAAGLQFLFFYGLATLSAMLTGNRFAMLAVYTGLNFVSMLVYAAVETIYLPMLTGISADVDAFSQLSPVCFMVEHFDYFTFDAIQVPSEKWGSYVIFYEYTGLGTGWSYLAVTAAVGLALMGLSFLLYKLRHLECAGDFVAFRKLNPLACLVITVCVALCFALIGELFTGGYLLWLAVGVAVGYFGSLMLIERRLRVFRPKTLIGFIALCAVLAGSILAVAFDIFGIEGWTPEAKDVQSVTVANYSSSYDYNGGNQRSVTLTREEDIARIIEAHRDILCNLDRDDIVNSHYVVLTYRLDSGRTVRRTYHARTDGTNYGIIRKYLYTPKTILGYEDGAAYAKNVSYMRSDIGYIPSWLHEKLLEALKVDCEAGFVDTYFDKASAYYIEYESKNPEGANTYRNLQILPGAEHTQAILESPELLLGYRDWDTYAERIVSLELNGNALDPAAFPELLEALKQDCENGSLKPTFAETSMHSVTLQVQYPDEEPIYREFWITSHAKHTMAWITEFYGPAGG